MVKRCRLTAEQAAGIALAAMAGTGLGWALADLVTPCDAGALCSLPALLPSNSTPGAAPDDSDDAYACPQVRSVFRHGWVWGLVTGLELGAAATLGLVHLWPLLAR